MADRITSAANSTDFIIDWTRYFDIKKSYNIFQIPVRYILNRNF